MSDKREMFGSRFGMIAAAVGSAVGLGNIWRFPYIVGANGGAAFLILYILLVVVIGIPLMMSEFVVGRQGRSDAINSYKNIAPKSKWFVSGAIGVLAAFFILSFYGVVAGWTIEYTRLAIFNKFAGQSSEQITNMFVNFMSHPIKPIITQLIAMFITGFIVLTGVQEGVEKASKIMIPILFVLLLILNVYSFTLEGGQAGFEFLFKPDFSQLTWTSFLTALGHAFFSLSLGMGVMVTYGSYIPDNENLFSSAIKISAADTIIATMAGIAIFPAVFAFGVEPSSGAGLVFMSLPNVFAQMTGGHLFGVAFFALLFLAALSSTISLLESVVAYLIDNFKWARKKATFVAIVPIILIGIISSLSNGPLSNIQITGKNIFDFIDSTTSNWFLTTSALIAVIFVGWKMDKQLVEKQITNDGNINQGVMPLFRFITKYVAPIGIIAVFLFQVFLS